MVAVRKNCRSPILEALENRRLLAAGVLDPTFGTGGITVTDFGGLANSALAVVLHDGKLYVSGSISTPTGDDFALARYNADGSLDTSWGSGGLVTTDLGSEFDNAYAIAIDTGGKIVLVGQTQAAVGYFNFAAVRYNTDGSLDSSFGAGGVVTVDFAAQFDQANSVAIQSDGKIVIGGSASVSFNSQFALVRLNTDGALDGTFGTGGKVTTEFLESYAESFSLALQSDGKIVLAGYANDWNTFDSDAAVARYNADGSLDTSFSSDGLAKVNFGRDDDVAKAVVLTPSGHMILGGYSNDTSSGECDFAAARLASDGSLDSAFGGGVVLVDFNGAQDQVFAAAVDADGKVVLAGRADNGLDRDFGLVRLNADGSLDSTFGAAGKVTAHVGGDDDQASGMVVMDDGKFVVVGSSTVGSTLRDVVLARFTTDDPAPDPDPDPEPEVNHDPVATLTAPTAGVRGFAMSFLGMFADEDLSDTHMVAWDFGDGAVLDFQSAADALEAAHTYLKSGQYTVTFTVKDQHGATSSATALVTVGSAGVSVDPVTGEKTLQVGGGSGTDILQLKLNRHGELVLFLGGVKQGVFQADKLVVNAGAGNDFIHIGKHVMLPIEIHAGDGNDVVHAGGGDAVLIGGSGHDHLFGGRGVNHLDGGEGHDFLHVPAHNEHDAVLIGGAGNDHLIGGAGDDMLDGGDGNDHLHGRKGNDTMKGGLGKDHYDHKGNDLIEDPDMVIKKTVKAVKAPKPKGK